MMNCYKYVLLLDDIVMQTGTLQASTEEVALARLKQEILPKEHYSRYHLEQKGCQHCGSYDDVLGYWKGQHQVTECVSCRILTTKQEFEWQPPEPVDVGRDETIIRRAVKQYRKQTKAGNKGYTPQDAFVYALEEMDTGYDLTIEAWAALEKKIVEQCK